LPTVFGDNRESWTDFEENLFKDSRERYNPGLMAAKRRVQCGLPGVNVGTGFRLEVTGRVSMVSPTMSSRQQYHPALWASFEAQDVEDKELVVLETYTDTPSAFLAQKAKEDSRLVHICIKVKDRDDDFTVGLKRNMTLHLASGEFCVNFDDDDLYAPCYAKEMVRDMQERNLQAITLSSWYNYYTTSGLCTYSDPQGWGDWVDEKTKLEDILYGYGFSFAHRRNVALLFPYDNSLAFAEDAPLFLNFRKVLGDEKVGLKQDDRGICVHIMHRDNSAGVKETREIQPEQLRSLAVWGLEKFREYVAAPKSSLLEESDDSSDEDEDESWLSAARDLVRAWWPRCHACA